MLELSSLERNHPGPAPRAPWVVVGAGLAVVALVVAIGILMSRSNYDAWAALVTASVLFAISIPVFVRQGQRERDLRTARLLAFALAAKLAGAIVRYAVAFGVYGGRADARLYWKDGLRYGLDLRHGIVDFHLHATGTAFIQSLTGIVAAGVGPSLAAAFIVFSWIGFWGLFLWYRAFTIAVPEGRRRGYAWLVFFMPSLVFWPSSVGKEAWMVFGLGLVAFGAARLMAQRTLNGLMFAALGLLACGVERPPVAGIAAIALAVAAVVRPSPDRFRHIGPFVKVAAAAALIAAAVLLVGRADTFLQRSGIDTAGGVGSVLEQTSNRTQQGGSKFTPSIVQSPAGAPLALVTVLFRPMLTDAGNAQSVLAALEGTFLFVLCIVRFRWILAALRRFRSRAYVAFAAVFVLLFVIGFSSIANFGLLVRERVQVLPAVLVLLCIPRRRPEAAPEPRTPW